MLSFKMYIDGKWENAASGKTYQTVNPATSEGVAEVPLGGEVDVRKAVYAAREALPAWSAKPQAERSSIIIKVAERLRERAEELAQLDIIDHGTPIKMARMWKQISIANLEYTAGAARALMGDTVPMRPGALFSLERQPVGVCALIIPWNSPILMVTSKMGACLATGNTCVIKPASICSLVALKFAEILEEVGLPHGVVNVITGPGGSVGNAMAKDPGIDLISFTGSSQTGKDIMVAASGTLKRLHMELGGKNPYIVLEDADLDRIALQAAGSTCANSGMVCASPGRYYIQEKVHDIFVEKFINAIQKIAVGDPKDEKTDMGPVVSKEHRDRVEGYIQSGVEEGAVLRLGGERPTIPHLNNGFYVMPTVLTRVNPHMKIFREEIFGPVACFIRFSDDDEVIASANDNVYGLCASVWTKDTARGMRIVSRINAGAVSVNNPRFVAPETPWGGFKESGFGKENSIHGLEEYTRIKLLAVDFS